MLSKMDNKKVEAYRWVYLFDGPGQLSTATMDGSLIADGNGDLGRALI